MESNNKRREIIKALQEQITNIDKEIEKLSEDKSLYQTIIQEINNNDWYEYDPSQSSSDISIEIIQDCKERKNTSHSVMIYISRMSYQKESQEMGMQKNRREKLERESTIKPWPMEF